MGTCGPNFFSSSSGFDIATFFGSSKGGWYEFTDVATIYADNAGTTLSSVDGTIQRINDKSPRAIHLVSDLITPVASPVRRVNNAINRGQTGNPALTALSQSSTFGSSAGMFACIAGTFAGGNTSGNAAFIADDNAPTTSQFSLYGYGASGVEVGVYDGANTNTLCTGAAATLPVGVPCVISFRVTGTTVILRVNKTQIATTTLAVAMASKAGLIQLASRRAAAGVNEMGLRGDLFAAMCIDRAPSDADMIAVEDYFTAMYGVDTAANGWNPSDKSASVTLTQSNRTETTSGAIASVRGVTSHTGSGKYQVEWLVIGLDETILVGFGRSTASLSNFPGNDANGFGYYGPNGNKYNGSGAVAYGAAYAVGDYIQGVIDFGTNEMTLYKNGVSQGIAFSGSSISSAALFPMVGSGTSGAGIRGTTINCGQRPFRYPIAGCTVWG